MPLQDEKPKQTVTVKRVLLPAPDLSDPSRQIYQIQYQAGELPPHFIYISEKDWTKEKEAAAIKTDINKRMAGTGETLSL
jgi:hypothetical protein